MHINAKNKYTTTNRDMHTHMQIRMKNIYRCYSTNTDNHININKDEKLNVNIVMKIEIYLLLVKVQIDLLTHIYIFSSLIQRENQNKNTTLE